MTTDISANGLVQMTGIDSAKIRARLAGLTPCRTQGKWKFFEIRAALDAVYNQDAGGRTESESDSKERREAAEADLAEIKRDQQLNLLIEVENADRIYTHAIQPAKEMLESLPTKFESQTTNHRAKKAHVKTLRELIAEVLANLSDEPGISDSFELPSVSEGDSEALET